MKQFAVTVMIPNRYWDIQVVVEAEDAEQAEKSVRAKFNEATELGYIQGEFRTGVVASIQ